MERDHADSYLRKRIESTIGWISAETSFNEEVEALLSGLDDIEFTQDGVPEIDPSCFAGSLFFEAGNTGDSIDLIAISKGSYDSFEDQGKIFATRIIKVKRRDSDEVGYFAGIFSNDQPLIDARRLPVGIVIDGSSVSLSSSLYDDTYEHQRRSLALATSHFGGNAYEEEAETHRIIVDEFTRAIEELGVNSTH